MSVAVEPIRVGTSSFELGFAVSVERDGESVEAARIRTVYVNVADGASAPLPDGLRAALGAPAS